MILRIIKTYRDIVAICDSELLGKKFEQGKLQLEIGTFFNGEEKKEAEILEIIKDAAKEDATFNIVGKQSINCALKAGIIDKEGIITIQGIPAALTLL